MSESKLAPVTLSTLCHGQAELQFQEFLTLVRDIMAEPAAYTSKGGRVSMDLNLKVRFNIGETDAQAVVEAKVMLPKKLPRQDTVYYAQDGFLVFEPAQADLFPAERPPLNVIDMKKGSHA